MICCLSWILWDKLSKPKFLEFRKISLKKQKFSIKSTNTVKLSTEISSPWSLAKQSLLISTKRLKSWLRSCLWTTFQRWFLKKRTRLTFRRKFRLWTLGFSSFRRVFLEFLQKRFLFNEKGVRKDNDKVRKVDHSLRHSWDFSSKHTIIVFDVQKNRLHQLS